MTLRIILKQGYGDSSIGPGGRATHHLSGEGECLLDMIGAPRPHLLFRDARGHAWRRGEHGALTLIDDATNLSDIEIELSSAAFRTISANFREEEKQRVIAATMQQVFLPLITAGLDTASLDNLIAGDATAFKMLQEAGPRRLERQFAQAWWSWRATRAVEDRWKVERWVRQLA